MTEISERTGLTQPNTSNHLACMVGCGLLERERDGRFVYYRHADQQISTLLVLADRIVSESTRDILACPHCGTRV